jgi:hypothetical protein
MSKGGAGKVYFVLYLAVILELLIIIVERDEAEEHLMKKQQESMRIVESILTQLQSGAGTEGINTRPQDAIVLSDNLPDDQKKLFKKFRTYFIEVGVTDVTSAVNTEGMDDAQKKEKIETLKKLANVQELQYEVYYHPSKEVEVPDSPPASEFKKAEKSPQAGMKLANSPNAISTEMWELKATRKLVLDIKSMADYQKPVYNESDNKTGDMNEFAPDDSARVNRIFGYSQDKTDKLRQNGKLTKRAFVCNFEPPTQPGWYKLRFSSQTNRIMGISADQKFNALKDDQKVNIGTVQLKVKDLKSVQRQLAEQLAGTGIPSADAFANGTMDIDKFNDGLDAAKKKAVENQSSEKTTQSVSRIDLYGYIAKLLSPGKYTSFDQNRGSIEIDIYVQKPEIEQLSPSVKWIDQKYSSFDEAPKVVAFLRTNLYDKKDKVPQVFLNGRQLSSQDVIKMDPNSKAKEGEWRVEIKQKLDTGTYKLLAKFSGSGSKGGSDSNSVELSVFPTSLFIGEEVIEGESYTVNNNEDLTNLLSTVSRDSKLSFNIKPSSGNQLPASQFETHIKTDEKLIIKKGFSISTNEGIEIGEDVSRVGVKIFWINPLQQDMRIPLYPSGEDKEITYATQIPMPGFLPNSENFEASNNPADPYFYFSVILRPRSGAKITEFTVAPDDKGGITTTGKGGLKYQLKPIGQPKLTANNQIVQKFSIVGKRPVPKGTSFKIIVKATAKQQLSNGSESKSNSRLFKTNLKY